MSATRDTSETTQIHFSRFHELYRNQKSKEEGTLTSGLVLKSGCVRTVSPGETKAIGSWSRAEDIQHGKKSLATQLSELRTARKRLSFLMSEMDELLKNG